jgi:NAD(P)-dependent dehydrogenase (short-subunit alcohol dehydrogenase family)
MTPGSTVDPQHILLIGAGPGVGAAIARRFGREGFRATLISRSEGKGCASRGCDARRR